MASVSGRDSGELSELLFIFFEPGGIGGITSAEHDSRGVARCMQPLTVIKDALHSPVLMVRTWAKMVIFRTAAC